MIIWIRCVSSTVTQFCNSTEHSVLVSNLLYLILSFVCNASEKKFIALYYYYCSTYEGILFSISHSFLQPVNVEMVSRMYPSSMFPWCWCVHWACHTGPRHSASVWKRQRSGSAVDFSVDTRNKAGLQTAWRYPKFSSAPCRQILERTITGKKAVDQRMQQTHSLPLV